MLRAQINPHFLFNALNTLYAIAMKENSEKTADGIQKLGDMMRFMLHENHQNRIPLAKEIEYLHNLISIQELRLDENQQIELKINLQNPDREVFIAPMLLNPFGENAFNTASVSAMRPGLTLRLRTIQNTFFQSAQQLSPQK
ncbi:MAG: histidine kinase [Haliscomenobacter sp.]|nr:histidine kinase [Haliscomenobacter sp.]MBK9490910.1 histidine kinase [Haliscomenobacter sp.]